MGRIYAPRISSCAIASSVDTQLTRNFLSKTRSMGLKMWFLYLVLSLSPANWNLMGRGMPAQQLGGGHLHVTASASVFYGVLVWGDLLRKSAANTNDNSAYTGSKLKARR